MPASLEQLESSALERLRQRENPFSSYVASLDEEQRYDVPERLAEQRRDINGIIDLFRQGNRPSQIIPILGEAGTGKTHLLASLKRELDNDQQLLVISEDFPKERDPADFFLWQIVSLLLGRKKTSVQILSRLSNRVTAALLGETIRRLSPSGRLRLVPPRGFWDWFGRKAGIAAAVDPSLKKVQDLLDICGNERFPEALPAFWDIGLDRDQVYEAVKDHVEEAESADADGFLRKVFYCGMVLSTVFGRREGLEDFLTGGFNDSPDHVAGAGDLTKRLLRVLLEIFAAFRIPVMIAFDQLEDFLRAGSREAEKELRENFCRGLIALTNAVPNLCVLLFAERGFWFNTVLPSLDQFSTDRLYRDISLPGKPNQRAIDLPLNCNLDTLAAIVRTRVLPTLGDLENKDQLPALFPFNREDLSGVLGEPSIRSCLQQLCKRYSEIVFSEHKGPSPREIHESLTRSWDQHRLLAQARLEDITATDIPSLVDALKSWLDYWADHHLSDPVPWVKNDACQHGHELFGHLNVLRTRPRSPGLGIGFWLAEGKHRPSDLAAKLAFFNVKSPVVRSLVILRRDGTKALGGVSGEHFKKAENKGHAVRVEELTDDDLVTILAFPPWLKAANAFVAALTGIGQEVGPDALNDIGRERTKLLMEKVRKWLAEPAEEATS